MADPNHGPISEVASRDLPVPDADRPATEEGVVERVEAILEPLNPTERREIIEQIMFHQGPLPPAELLRQYDLVVPGLAREIADGAASEREFRHDMTRRTGNREFILNLAGLGAILIALTMMLGIVAYMVSVDAPYAGATLGAAIIVGVIVALSNYRKADNMPLPRDKPSRSEDE